MYYESLMYSRICDWLSWVTHFNHGRHISALQFKQIRPAVHVYLVSTQGKDWGNFFSSDVIIEWCFVPPTGAWEFVPARAVIVLRNGANLSLLWLSLRHGAMITAASIPDLPALITHTLSQSSHCSHGSQQHLRWAAAHTCQQSIANKTELQLNRPS